MRISAKGRYALAAVVSMAMRPVPGGYITVLSISEGLGISKIYLEQVFSLLKRGGLVFSVKGAQGGYQLTRPPRQITVFQVLSAVELSLFEPAEATVAEKSPALEAALRTQVFDAMDKTLQAALNRVSIADLVAETEKNQGGDFMYYI